MFPENRRESKLKQKAKEKIKQKPANSRTKGVNNK